jgi:hypothetical protein
MHPGRETGFVSAYRMGKDGELTQLSRDETGGTTAAAACRSIMSRRGLRSPQLLGRESGHTGPPRSVPHPQRGLDTDRSRSCRTRQ